MRGGSAGEAMRIGHLLHRLHVATAIGWLGLSKPDMKFVYYPEASMQDKDRLVNLPGVRNDHADCDSACIYIWLGGWLRYGYAYLGIHRPRFFPPPEEHIVPEELDRFYALAQKIETSYVTQFSGNADLENRIWAIPNDAPEMLDPHYIIQNLDQPIPSDSTDDQAALCVHDMIYSAKMTAAALGLQLDKAAQCDFELAKSSRVERWAKYLP
jgi:hypothetical protein